MKKIKSLIAVLLSLLFIAFALGCGDSSSAEPSTTAEPTEPSIGSIINKATLQYPSSNDLFKYNVYDVYVEITEYIGDPSAQCVTVPATLEDLPVYVVADGAFGKSCSVSEIIFEDGIYTIHGDFGLNTDLKKVTLPSTLHNMSFGMFENSYALETVIIPEGIERIGNKAFMSCTSLKEITLPSTITSIDSEAFAFSAIEKINLPQGLTHIYDKAFLGCESLRSLTLPDTLKEIGEAAFQSSGLEALEIPESVQKIGPTLFTGCENLATLKVFNADMEIENSEGYNFTLLFNQCNPNLVVHGKAGSTIAKQCARENIFFEVIK